MADENAKEEAQKALSVFLSFALFWFFFCFKGTTVVSGCRLFGNAAELFLG